jgi:GPH family glycoside/pentoside/hexuronide:cation symporter
VLFQFELPDMLLFDDRTVTVQGPYLILIPTVLLSAGMLMFFTLGASMVGDVCDEDELHTGTRSEGTYYSVFWWFIKMGTAFASLVTGALLVFTSFNERQNVTVDALRGEMALIKAEAGKWQQDGPALETRVVEFERHLDSLIGHAEKLRHHFEQRQQDDPDQTGHLTRLIEGTDSIRGQAQALRANSRSRAANPAEVIRETNALLDQTTLLKQQTPKTLFRLRLVEIGVPLALSCLSILLTLLYPLTDARTFEIKEALKKRHEESPASSA